MRNWNAIKAIMINNVFFLEEEDDEIILESLKEVDRITERDTFLFSRSFMTVLTSQFEVMYADPGSIIPVWAYTAFVVIESDHICSFFDVKTPK